MRVAVLFFGQLRLLDNYHTNFDSLKKFLGVPFDVFVHCWFSFQESSLFDVSLWARGDECGKIDQDSLPFMVEYYKPTKLLVEPPQQFQKDDFFHPKTSFVGPQSQGHRGWKDIDVSNMLSQVVSVSKVCNLVNIDNYDVFVLTRFDTYFEESINIFELVLENQIHRMSDVVQIVGKETILSYRTLMETIKTTPFEWLNAEQVRACCLPQRTRFLDDLRAKVVRSSQLKSLYIASLNERLPENDIYLYTTSSSLTMCKIAKNHFKIIKQRFPVNKQSLSYQWIGNLLKVNTPLKISFAVKFIDKLPDSHNKSIGSKTHNPDRILNQWISDVQEVGVWYPVRLEVVLSNPLFIYLFLDNCPEALTFELKIDEDTMLLF